MSDLNALHTTEALSQLLENFQNSESLKALLVAYVDQVQDLENATQPIIDARNFATMDGHRLEGLGEIVDVPRDGRSDEDYRLRISAELSILKSTGIESDIISILQLLLLLPTSTIQLDEYFPKTIFVRPTNFDGTSTDWLSVFTLLKRAMPAGSDLHIIHGEQADDDNLFRFSDTAGVNETSSSHGFNNGDFAREDT